MSERIDDAAEEVEPLGDVGITAAGLNGESITLTQVILGLEPYVILRWELDKDDGESKIRITAGGGLRDVDEIRNTLQAAIEGLPE